MSGAPKHFAGKNRTPSTNHSQSVIICVSCFPEIYFYKCTCSPFPPLPPLCFVCASFFANRDRPKSVAKIPAIDHPGVSLPTSSSSHFYSWSSISSSFPMSCTVALSCKWWGKSQSLSNFHPWYPFISAPLAPLPRSLPRSLPPSFSRTISPSVSVRVCIWCSCSRTTAVSSLICCCCLLTCLLVS